jgi:hypothetical protein
MTRLMAIWLVLLAVSPARAQPAPVAKKYATRAEVGVELAPGVAIPFKKYLDFGSGEYRYTMQNGAGFGFGLAVLLNRFELQWSYARLGAGQVSGRVPDEIVNNVKQYFQKDLPTVISGDAPGPLVVHTLTLGYRLTFEPRPRLKLGVPIGGGLAITEPPAFGIVNYSLFGFAGHVGFLAEYQIARVISVGGNLRFTMLVTEPDPNLAGAGIAATKKIFENAVAWLPLLAVGAHVRVHY